MHAAIGVTPGLLFTGFFDAGLLRMTGGLRRTATQGGPYNISGSLVQDRRGGISARLPHQIYAVILNEGKDPVFCGFGVLFTGFFTAVAVQNDRGSDRFLTPPK